MKQLAANQHYVPQMYLRNWSQDNNKIWVYRKLVSHKNVPLWDEMSIERTASLTKAYSHTQNGEESDDFENWFNLEVETPVKPIIEKIINGESISQNEWTPLLRFTMAQMTRTFAYYVENYNKFLNSAQTVLNNWEQGVDVFKKPYSQKIKQFRPLSNDEYTPIKGTILGKDEDFTYVEMKIAVGRSLWLSHIKRMVEQHVEHFEKCEWHIIEVAEGVKFPTSDNPVISLSKNGIFVPNNQILFPLSPKHLLYTRVGNKCPINKMQKNFNFSQAVRQEILRNGFLYIYSKSSRKQYMNRDCPRTIDETEYKRISQELKEWHSLNSEIEARYFTDDEIIVK